MPDETERIDAADLAHLHKMQEEHVAAAQAYERAKVAMYRAEGKLQGQRELILSRYHGTPNDTINEVTGVITRGAKAQPTESDDTGAPE